MNKQEALNDLINICIESGVNKGKWELEYGKYSSEDYSYFMRCMSKKYDINIPKLDNSAPKYIAYDFQGSILEKEMINKIKEILLD